ncbi:hypothetical protein [Methylomonas rhizoryzae]|uniref:hypothetical protein n=1 Tax=Methylomonas rhizoryzae TaxID=2608981 RepID=UPI0012321EEE|nr:hypothetical protein [Methylomonas rhizoryzae]
MPITHRLTPADAVRSGIGQLLAVTTRSARYVLLACLLTGCRTPAVRLPEAELSKLQSVLIVALETPPLDIEPDPIEDRIPAYAHYRNMAMPLDPERHLYRNAGGIVIAGAIAPNELDTFTLVTAAEQASGPAPIWTPTVVLAEIARANLSDHWLHSRVHRDIRPLPIVKSERNAQLQHWRRAVENWYAQADTDSRYSELHGYDAVVEIGVNRYRIFAGQVSLQVMLKLINPKTGRVLARTAADSYCVDDAALHSLQTDGAAFKKLISELGERLLARAFDDLGWHVVPATPPLALK